MIHERQLPNGAIQRRHNSKSNYYEKLYEACVETAKTELGFNDNEAHAFADWKIKELAKSKAKELAGK